MLTASTDERNAWKANTRSGRVRGGGDDVFDYKKYMRCTTCRACERRHWEGRWWYCWHCCECSVDSGRDLVGRKDNIHCRAPHRAEVGRMQAREKNREFTACDKCYREMHESGMMRAKQKQGGARNVGMSPRFTRLSSPRLTEAGTHLKEVQISRTYEKAQTACDSPLQRHVRRRR